MQIEIPRFTVVRTDGVSDVVDDLVCMDIDEDDDDAGVEPATDDDAEPSMMAAMEMAAMMFTRREKAQRFIVANEMVDCTPVYLGYEELRVWLIRCLNGDVRWAYIDFLNVSETEVFWKIQISDAVAAIDRTGPADLEIGEPVYVEAESLEW